MKESEAIKILKKDSCYECAQGTDSPFNCEYVGCRVAKATRVAIQALEKQIPKKPNKTIDSSWGIKKEVHVCPVCDYYLTEVHFIAPKKIESNKKITYCEICGQAIDWSDEKR